ncbi:NnrU family protein [Novosphingobium sp.]|uniref:NnrU family protein n=1 Tax=Novosphingobium sp. TaxID=1874826 RepID=UPI0025EC4840|nr:NnrU family protein [Novosphingobium sp.]MCC6926673.1 MFS transporter [Novosphingobium sp.]
MNEEYASLVAATLTFVGTHFALSHPLRAGLVKRLGAGGFSGLYSLVALASFAWMALAFRGLPMAEHNLWDGSGEAAWALASLVMLAASVLLAGSFKGNPAMPRPDAAEQARHRPKGVFRVTRHPMMWSMALWSVAHILVSPTPRVLILGLAIGFLALVGSFLQDRKKSHLMGPAWDTWERHTTFLPRPAALLGAGAGAWLGGIALWLSATWLHLWLTGIPAGPWRWL